MNRRPDKLEKGCPYTRVEYLENLGWSRVFLPVYPKAGDVVEIESELSYTDVSFRQSELAGYDAPWFFWGVYDTPTWYAGGTDTLYSQQTADTDWHVFKLVSLGDAAGLWIDGQKIVDIKQYPDVVYAPQGIELWSYSNGRRNSLNRKKWLRITINGKEVMYLLPVLDAYGVPALYDSVSRQLFYNIGEDALVAGPMLLPSGYAELEYLEGTGSQYCSIPVLADGSDEREFSCLSDIQFLGSTRQLMGFSTNACCYWGCNGGTAYELGLDYLLPVDVKKRQLVKFCRKSGVANLVCSGASKTRTTMDAPKVFNSYGILHAVIKTATVDICQARLFSVKIYEDEKMTRDMIPILDSGGVCCLFDRVSGRCFYSEGEEHFIAGPLLGA